jgi:hypothetical protein
VLAWHGDLFVGMIQLSGRLELHRQTIEPLFRLLLSCWRDSQLHGWGATKRMSAQPNSVDGRVERSSVSSRTRQLH